MGKENGKGEGEGMDWKRKERWEGKNKERKGREGVIRIDKGWYGRGGKRRVWYGRKWNGARWVGMQWVRKKRSGAERYRYMLDVHSTGWR